MLRTNGFDLQVVIEKLSSENKIEKKQRSGYNKRQELQVPYLSNQQSGEIQNVEWEAFDPGERTLYYGSKGTKMSRKEWKSRLGIKSRQKHLENSKKLYAPHIQNLEDILSLHTLKVASFEEFVTNVQVHLNMFESKWQFYTRKVFLKKDFNSFQLKQKTLTKVCNDIFGKNRKKVAIFGDGNWPVRGMKGRESTPVTFLRNHLGKHGNIFLVDEYRTSRRCNSCEGQEDMVIGRMKNKEGVNKVNYGVYHCQNKLCRHRTCHRDLNASLNIGLIARCILENKLRPIYLSRNIKASCHSGRNTFKMMKST